MQCEQAISAISRLAVDRSCEVHTQDIKYFNCSCQSCEPARWKMEPVKTVRVYPELQSAHLTNTTIKDCGIVTGMRSAQRFCWRSNSQAYPFTSYYAWSTKQLRLDSSIYAIISSRLLTVLSRPMNIKFIDAKQAKELYQFKKHQKETVFQFYIKILI